MARKYLDTTGLTALWAKIKGLFNGLATVATTGSYNDLTDKPTVAEIDDSSTAADKAWSASKINTTKVSRSGDTMTGALISPAFTASATGSPTFNSQSTDIDASKTNNDISSDHYPAWMASDKYGRILTRMECVASSNGNIAAYWYVRNYNTSGSQVGQKGIRMSMDKGGNISYTIDENGKFRTALGLATVASSGSYNDLSNKPTIPDISGKVNKSGDTMTGDLADINANIWIRDTDIKVGTAPSSTIWGNGFFISSSNGGDLCYLRACQDTSDRVGMQLEARRVIGSSTYYNTVHLRITNNGTKVIEVSDPAAWRSAIGCGLSAVSFTRSHASVSYTEGLVCNRFGNVVTFAGYFSCGATIAGNTTLYSGLPKPAGGKHIYFTWSGLDFYLHATDGTIRTNGQITAKTYVGTFTYVCA